MFSSGQIEFLCTTLGNDELTSSIFEWPVFKTSSPQSTESASREQARIRWVAVFRRKICERLGNPLTLIAMSPHEFQLNDAGGK